MFYILYLNSILLSTWITGMLDELSDPPLFFAHDTIHIFWSLTFQVNLMMINLDF